MYSETSDELRGVRKHGQLLLGPGVGLQVSSRTMDHFKSFIDKYGILKKYEGLHSYDIKREEPKNLFWDGFGLQKIEQHRSEHCRYRRNQMYEYADDCDMPICRKHVFKTPSLKIGPEEWYNPWNFNWNFAENMKRYLCGERGWEKSDFLEAEFSKEEIEFLDAEFSKEDIENYKKGQKDWLYIRDDKSIHSILIYILEDRCIEALELLCSIDTPEMTRILSQKMYTASYDPDSDDPRLYDKNAPLPHKGYYFHEDYFYTPLEYACKEGHVIAFDILANRLGLTWTDRMKKIAFYRPSESFGLSEMEQKKLEIITIQASYRYFNFASDTDYFEEYLKHWRTKTDNTKKEISRKDNCFLRLLQRHEEVFGYNYYPELFSTESENVRDNIDAFIINVEPSLFRSILPLLDIEYNLFVGRFVWLQGRLSGDEKRYWEKNFTFFIDFHKDKFYCHLAYQDFLDYDKSKEGFLNFELSMINSQRRGIANNKKSPRELLKLYDHWHKLHEDGEDIYPHAKKYIDGMKQADDITIVDTDNYDRDVKPHISDMKEMNTKQMPLCYYGPGGAERNIKNATNWLLAKNEDDEVVAFLAYTIKDVSFYIAWEASILAGNNKPLKFLVLAKAIDKRVARLSLDLCGGHWLSNPGARKVDSDFGFEYIESQRQDLDLFVRVIKGDWKRHNYDHLVGTSPQRKKAIETLKNMNLCPVTFRKEILMKKSPDENDLKLYNVIRKKFYLERNGPHVYQGDDLWKIVGPDPDDSRKIIIQYGDKEKSVGISTKKEIQTGCTMELDDLNVSHLVHMFNVVMNSQFDYALFHDDISVIANFNRINADQQRRMSVSEPSPLNTANRATPGASSSTPAPAASSSTPAPAASSLTPAQAPASPPPTVTGVPSTVDRRPRITESNAIHLQVNQPVICRDRDNMFQEAKVTHVKPKKGSMKNSWHTIEWKDENTIGSTTKKTNEDKKLSTHLFTPEQFKEEQSKDSKPQLKKGTLVIVNHIDKKRKRNAIQRYAKIIEVKFPNQYKVQYCTKENKYDGEIPEVWYHNFYKPGGLESGNIKDRRLCTNEEFISELGGNAFKAIALNNTI